MPTAEVESGVAPTSHLSCHRRKSYACRGGRPGGVLHRSVVSAALGCASLVGVRERLLGAAALRPPAPSYEVKGNELIVAGRSAAAIAENKFGRRAPMKIEFFRVQRSRGDIACLLIETGELTTTPLIVFSHGNSTDIGWMLPRLLRLANNTKCNVLAYDYSGFGLSRGVAPLPKELLTDIRAVFFFAIHDLGVPSENVILAGQSIGSGPTCDLAVDESASKIAGVVLLSPIASVLRVVMNEGSGYVSALDCFCNKDKIKDVNVPILIIHGQVDTQIPIQHSHELLKSCSAYGKNCQWLWIPDAGHSDLELRGGSPFYRRIRNFIHEVTVQPEEVTIAAASSSDMMSS